MSTPVLVTAVSLLMLCAAVVPAAAADDLRPRVNQVGYLTDGPKLATVVSDSTAPVLFSVRDEAGTVVFSGETKVRGLDPSAGMRVHTADFTGIEQPGRYVLTVDGAESYPFEVGPDVYRGLIGDALGYYYPVRSGIDIDPAIAGEGYGRPAGHLGRPGDPVNQGDYAVPCQAPESSEAAYGEPWSCDYVLDVPGGWYDAGDHGKYVVNGGISVAQLLATYERLKRRGDGSEALLGDATLRVPEAGNGVPDILDEVRWELDFMLAMVVPEGQPMAGMVHHKVHDNEWTAIPLLPSDDPKKRELHRPSTAATLNLAAAAAHASRLFREFDEAYAARLLEAARLAYSAAQANPEVYAPAADGDSGGGPYDDADVSDEFYWAAAELLITTGEAGFLDDLKASPHWAGEVFGAGAFDWGHVQGFARLELAAAPEILPPEDARMVRDSVLAAADAYLKTQGGQPFGHPYAPAEGKYEWGSTHLVIQNALVIATAYDLSGDEKYRHGALEAMDYVFGRNALNLSFVTGYGTAFSQNQHSRWFAHQADPLLPHPPRGALSGGPNSNIEDPVAQALFAEAGCAPQLCYVDDIESWSTNEITINWNAALSQMAGWLAVHGPLGGN